jgi:hypothetical protein
MFTSLSRQTFAPLSEVTSVSLSDVPFFLTVCAAYYCYRLILVKGPLASLGRALKVKRLHKFVHRTFDALHYLIGAIVGLFAIVPRDYGHCFAYAKDCQDFLWQNPEGFLLTVAEKVYFILFFAYYAVDVAFLWTASDRLMMIIHHIVTLTEIAACVVLRSPVVGLSIMLLHDVTDVPLYLAKFFIYVRLHGVATMFLALFALSCTYFRIVNYPMIVYHVGVVGKGTTIYPMLYKVEWMCLMVLYALHLIWEGKIISHVVMTARGTQIRDKRSDDSE